MIEMVVGVCRNSSGLVSATFHALKDHELLRDATWFVVNSNSQDKTHLELEALSSSFAQFQYEVLSNDSERSSKIERIRRARNAYVSQIRISLPEHVAVIDFDSRLLRHVSLPSTLDFSREKTILTARQSWCYYDVFAFQPLRAWKPLEPFFWTSSLRSRIGNWFLRVIPTQILITFRAKRELEVRSAFGGFAVYPGDLFIQADYSSDSAWREECEHLSLHEQARADGYRVFIDPSLAYGRTNEHCFPCVFLDSFKQFFAGRGLIKNL